MTDDNNIKKFVERRNSVLLTGDVDAVMAFAKEMGSEIKDREVAEIGMHKARTAIIGFPEEEKEISRQWLKERGYKTLEENLADLKRENDQKRLN